MNDEKFPNNNFTTSLSLVAFSLTFRYAGREKKVQELKEEAPLEYSTIRESVQPVPFHYAKHRNWILGVVVGAIFLTTSVMSLLEPCLPLWLMKTMKPEVRYDFALTFGFNPKITNLVCFVVAVATRRCFHSRQLWLLVNHSFPRWSSLPYRTVESGHDLYDSFGDFLHFG